MALEQRRDKYILLPVLYESWPRQKSDLRALASKEAAGLDALKKVLERNDSPARPELDVLEAVLSDREDFTKEHFCQVQLPWLALKALQVEELFKDSKHKIKNLYTGCEGEVVLSRRQVCSLLSLAFFDCFSKPEGQYQKLTLAGFLTSSFMYHSQASKLLCMLNYFERIQQAEEMGDEEFLSLCVSVTRRSLSQGEASRNTWRSCTKPLLGFESLSEGLIEEAHGCLQVDFANSFIGGGVLRMGCVQEEIRFVISPECLVSMLFCEEMDKLESILITGAEQFSSYTGYGGKFMYKGPFKDPNPVDNQRRRRVSIVAIDATPYGFSSSESQFQLQDVSRELNKAYSGFTHSLSQDKPNSGEMAAVATGNWGCGAFGGDKRLKTLIQWLAASRAGRNMRYFTFTKDEEFSQRQKEVMEKLCGKEVTVGKLYMLLVTSISKGDVFEQMCSNV